MRLTQLLCNCSIFICFYLPSHSNAEQLHFSAVYDLARQVAPDLAVAKYKVDGAQANSRVALGAVRPQISLFGQLSDNEIEYEDTAQYLDQNYSGERYGVLVRQSILDVSRFREASRLSLVYRQTQQELAVAEAALLSDLTKTYLNVLLSDAELAQLKVEKNALDSQLDEAEALYAKNLIPVTQLLETQARADTLQADIILADGKTAIAREDLTRLTGRRGVEPVPLANSMALLSGVKSAEEAAVQAIQSSPDIAAARIALEAAQRGVDREKGAWIPKIDLTFNYQHSDVGFDNLASPARDTSSIAIGFNYPLYEGGAGSGRLDLARSEYRIAETRFAAVQRASEARARSAWLSLAAAEKRLLAARQAVKSSAVQVVASRKAVKAGTARITDVLVALAQNTRAVRDLSQAQASCALAWVELKMAVGTSPLSLASELSVALHGS